MLALSASLCLFYFAYWIQIKFWTWTETVPSLISVNHVISRRPVRGIEVLGDWQVQPQITGYVVHGDSITTSKVKVHTLDIAPLHSESPLQKLSIMAHVLKGFHSFTCTPTRSSAIRMSHTCLCLPRCRWYSFTDPGGMEGWVYLGAK